MPNYRVISPMDQWLVNDDGDIIGARRRRIGGTDFEPTSDSALVAKSTATPTSSDTVLGVQGGVVKRFYKDAIGPFVNVKDPAYGAVGDGTTDDTAAIQAAIDSISSDAELYFPNGSYRLASRPSISNKSRIRVRGDKATIKPDTNIGFLLIDTCTDVEVTGFKVLGTFDTTTVYADNAEQGRIVPQDSNGVHIHGNEWNMTSGAVFVQTGCDGVFFHHNRVIKTHGGIQTSGAVYKNLWITDNYFEGHVFTNAIQGSDDQIAVFGSAGGQVVIARNVVDKKGPTAYNQARAINISVGDGSDSEIIVSENIVKNVVTTTAVQARAAIIIEGESANTATRVHVTNNIVTNCNIPISVGALAANVLVGSNNISQAVVLGGFSNSGSGIYVNVSGDDAEIVINGNLLQGCGLHGINASSSPKIVIASNFVKGSTNRGVSLDGCNDAVISSNLCTGNQDGLLINNSERISVCGNVATSNTRYGLRTQGTTVSGSVVGNTLKSNTSADWSDAATTLDVEFVANYGVGSRGISSTSTPSRNLGGTATFAGAATKAVSFSVAEADTSYRVALSASANENIWITAKATTGFTLNSSNATSTAVVDWALVR